MAEFNDYFFAAINKVSFSLIDPNNYDGYYSLGGLCIGRSGFADNSLIKTSNVEKLEDNTVTTKSGSHYQFKDMHEDYKDFLSAIEKGIEVINNWGIIGNLREGYILYGSVNGENISERIISQEGNLITLINNKTYFVMWSDFSVETKICIESFGKDFGIKYPNGFENFCGYRCKPILFPK